MIRVNVEIIRHKYLVIDRIAYVLTSFLRKYYSNMYKARYHYYLLPSYEKNGSPTLSWDEERQ